MPLKVLIATTDESLAGMLDAMLAPAQMETATIRDGAALQRRLHAETPDMLVMDFDLPEPGALELCRELRANTATNYLPIIMLTGESQVADRVAALQAGADDCLSKPPHPEEMLARIDALRRRSWTFVRGRHLRAGGIEMDLERWTVKMDRQPVKLTRKEFRLLQMLLEARGRALSREFLLEHAWPHGTIHGLDTRTIDVHIGRLRRKLGKAGRHIITVRNVGFRFDIVAEWI